MVFMAAHVSAYTPHVTRRTRLACILTALFLLATAMGAGPGLALVTPGAGETPATFLGMPALYVWLVFWFGVEVAVIAIASVLLWRDE